MALHDESPIYSLSNQVLCIWKFIISTRLADHRRTTALTRYIVCLSLMAAERFYGYTLMADSPTVAIVTNTTFVVGISPSLMARAGNMSGNFLNTAFGNQAERSLKKR